MSLGWKTRAVGVILLAGMLAMGAFVASFGQEDSWFTIVKHSSDTDQILPRVKQGLSCVPRSIKDPLLASGYKIVITPFMAYGTTGGDEHERRSSYDVSSVNNIAGQFRSSDKAVYIPERCA